ncbi:carboxypeptidase regulatory-like domain-containing protein [Micromonospora globbae]|uniref:Carboxypeptidase regulatory-like domain-containing protein n=1 Tax=Micromonospora globbae TaxID=1894969 RepID=A0A420F2Q3_9ACTN|nr:carboxypeptidase regulatory-like domain-containing protein [Micromonospora globbae]RKF27262.1 galactose oxidase [Micromonospora globbae]
MAVPIRSRRVHRGRLGALIAALTLSLLASGPLPAAPAQAAPASAPPTASSPSWEAMRYTPAGCNTAAEGTPLARCYALGRATEDGRLVQQESAPPAGALGPADIRSAYKLPDGGAGRTVAVVLAFGYEAAEADLAVFRAHYGLPPCTSANGCFRKVDQRGGTDYPPEDPDWSIEAALDLDAVSSACPKCNLLLVQADDNSPASLGAAVDTAARLGATVISNSYGIAGETPFQELYNAHYDHPGVAVVVASGDIGNLQSYPATHPDVIAVGGTRLTRDSSPRGWSETAWVNAGSGCSLYEPRPEYQAGVDTRCGDKRATADISAVADPESGLAVYNTLGQDGWAQWGGTSLAAPLVAGMYALAGDPLPGSYPVTYPYRKDKTAGLFDITEGSNGWCGDLLCNAGPGWDGPTGLGSPNGVSALTLGATGRITGTVTTGRTNGAVAGATVTATDGTGAAFRATTDAQGRYDLRLPAGGYDVAVTEFGYRAPAAARLTVAADAELTHDVTLTALASRTLTGTVTDGSGHGWPIHARISIDGYPGGAVLTDPYTGRYEVDLPVDNSYTLRVSPVDLPGYVTGTVTVRVDQQPKGRPRDVRQDVRLSVDTASCTAPGYAPRYEGANADFTGWTGDTPKDGWRTTDEAGGGQTWRFDDPNGKGNLTGGTGGFATVDGWSQPGPIDTSLVSPPADLTGVTDPVIGFDTDYSSWDTQTGDVDLSLDNGATWTNVRHYAGDAVNGHVEIPVPQAAGKSGVLVRFRYQGETDDWWQLDNVFVGRRSCAAVPGGLVAGQVRDDNTGAALIGATVTAGGAVDATSRATPEDANLADGFYWLFAPGTRPVTMTVSGRHYGDATATVRIDPDGVTRRDWRLEAGRLDVRQSDLSVAVRPGRSVTRKVRLTNDGDRPLRVNLVEQDRGYSPAAGGRRATAPEAPLVRVRTETSVAARGRGHGSPPPPQQAGNGTAWTTLPDYPTLVMDNLVADNDGTVYSVGGSGDSGSLAEGYVLDPQAGSWSRIADLPEPRAAAVGGFVDGRLYAVGGWDEASNAATTTYAYDPMTDRWSRRADLPSGVTAAAAASVGGRLYVVAGCTTGDCEPASNRTYRYDPRTDTWSRLADYPLAVAFLACAPAGDGVVCAGGIDPGRRVPTNEAFRYFAESDTWVPTTPLPISRWGMAYAGAGGKLQVVGGIAAGSVNNEALEFDPETGVWTELPNANNALYRGGAACGLYQVGGSLGSFAITPYAQHLPGHDACVRGSDVSWLSVDRTEVTIPAGRSVTVTVTAAAPAVAGHGVYRARLAFDTDTPYRTEPLTVAMTLR